MWLLMSVFGRAISIIELGTCKTRCFVIAINEETYEIIARKESKSEGFAAGQVTNMQKLTASIAKVVYQAEQEFKGSISNVYVVITGEYFQLNHTTGHIKLANRAIQEQDIGEILDYARKSSQDIFAYAAISSYDIDGNNNIENPIGMIGKILTTRISLLTSDDTPIKNIINCLQNLGINVLGLIPFEYVMGLSLDVSNAISICIDLGGGSTKVAIFQNEAIIEKVFIPFGGDKITQAISEEIGMSYDQAERLKVLHGSAVLLEDDYDDLLISLSGQPENDKINIKKAHLNATISHYNNQIFKKIKNSIEPTLLKKSKFVYLFGGGSNCTGIEQAFAEVFDKKAVKIMQKQATSITQMNWQNNTKNQTDSKKTPYTLHQKNHPYMSGISRFIRKNREKKASAYLLASNGVKSKLMQIWSWISKKL
jgi:cell division protein FtsA